MRAFLSRLKDEDVEFFRKSGTQDMVLVDSTTASEWNLKGCAVSGPAAGTCLTALPAIKDFWSGMIQSVNAKSAVLESVDVRPTGDGVVEIGRPCSR